MEEVLYAMCKQLIPSKMSDACNFFLQPVRFWVVLAALSGIYV